MTVRERFELAYQALRGGGSRESHTVAVAAAIAQNKKPPKYRSWIENQPLAHPHNILDNARKLFKDAARSERWENENGRSIDVFVDKGDMPRLWRRKAKEAFRAWKAEVT